MDKGRNVIIGTAGHVDHGKTCLIRALTGTETDRLKEEQKRGITIELGFAEMADPDGRKIGIIDVPGHEKFVRNMLAGIGGIDLVLLVIAADEGIMPQTVEHFEILKMLGIKEGIVVITKSDMVDAEWLDLVKEDVAETVKGTFLEKAPLITVSSHTGDNIDQLRQKIFQKTREVTNRREDQELLRIPVDRVFTMEGFGTVITGTLLEGSLAVGDEVQIYPGDKKAKVRNLQVHGDKVEKAFAGQRTAVNLINIKKEEIDRGDVLAAKDSLKQTMMVDVKINMFSDSPRNLLNGSRLHLYYGSAETLCKAILLDREVLKSGESAYAQLRMEEDIAVRKGDRFIVRFYSPVETIGGGVILDANPPKHRRFREEVLQALEVKELGQEEDILAQVLRELSKNLPKVRDLALKLGLTGEEVEGKLKELTDEGMAFELEDGVYIHKDFGQDVQARVEKLLSDFHGKNPLAGGMQKGEFRKKLADALYLKEGAKTDGLLKLLVDLGKIKESENHVFLPTHKVEFGPEHREILKRMEAKYKAAAYEFPEIEEAVAGEKDKALAISVIESMGQQGLLKRLSYQNYMDQNHFEEALRLLKDHVEKEGDISLAQFRDLLGSSRKYAVAILEYLDNQKITAMVDDKRILL